MKRILRLCCLITLALAAFLCFPLKAQDKVVKKVPPRPTVSLDGKTLYNQYCAVCHGPDGKGAGPAASALKTPPPDLTQIARQNNGHFPDDHIMQELRGGGHIASHGSEDMPVWGPIFSNMSGNLTQTQARMHALINYLEGMQAK
jgi:mono/diheme cytochrome c family protein